MQNSFSLISFSDPCPQKNIALDEVLLLKTIETRQAHLRLWKNTKKTIYLGIGKKIDEDVFRQRAQKEGVWIVRRFSGGGTVFHDSEVINYTLTFPLEHFPQMSQLSDSYDFILRWINRIFFECSQQKLSLKGGSDFCLNHLKVAGNAQARRHNTLLHHGSFINSINLSSIESYLKEPLKRPEYRQKKTHRHFLSDLRSQGFRITDQWIKNRLKKSHWIGSEQSFCLDDHSQAEELKKLKYGNDSWNYRL